MHQACAIAAKGDNPESPHWCTFGVGACLLAVHAWPAMANTCYHCAADTPQGALFLIHPHLNMLWLDYTLRGAGTSSFLYVSSA